MGSKWPSYPLEHCLDAIIDYRGKTPRKTASGIPLITAKIVKNGRILPVQEYIAADEYDSWMRRGLPMKGDVLLTTEAPLGEVAQLDGRKVALAQRLIALRGKNGFLDNTFLKYQLQSHEVQHQLQGRASGTTVSGIKQSELRKVILSVPPMLEQRAIAHILGTLDDKIELNRKMNKTLEAMAQALFKSWFVDFDPVIDNAILAGNPIPDEFAQRAEQRRAIMAQNQPSPPGRGGDEGLPNEFEFTDEMGWIPKGWKPCGFGDIADDTRRSVNPDEVPPTTPYIGLQHMPRRCIALDTWGRADEVGSQKSLFKEGEILFGKLRPYFHKVGIAPVDGICSTDILVVVPKAEFWHSYVLSLLFSKAFIDYTDSHSAGTKMPRTNWKDMSQYLLALPPVQLASVFQNHVAVLHKRIVVSVRQNHHLARLRDTLLPKLMNGEIDLEVAEEVV